MIGSLVAAFFAGALLCNALPHTVAGLMGHGFPTPFATPHGVGFSPPIVNFVWGFANVCGGIALLVHWPIALAYDAPLAAFLAGALLLGAGMARHFGKVQADRAAAAASVRPLA